MTDSHDREQELFARAMELGSSERAAYLDQACGDDPGLRAQVESLLEAMEQAGHQGFFNQPTSGLGDIDEESQSCSHGTDDLQPEEVIGHYKVLERIGQGGFGRVYRAEQFAPIKREVALKVIKL
ncbi:MAG TPA: serine/threonine protein kinase, partial [Phycisphaerales bacterium]|nr:serine/threonine protein kinase [Phycisphaerales bacterium]